MSWFEAWLIWRLDAIQTFFILITILVGAWGILCIVAWVEDEDKFGKIMTIINWPVFLVFLFLSFATPPTETFFKIIATKYGADALTSQKASEIGNNVLESIEKAQQALNKKLDELNGIKETKK